MAFHFPLMPRLFAALRKADRHPISDILARTPVIPGGCQWGIFLRNHDELTLEMVSDEERAYMYEQYAPEPRMRANIGIRRRLAPLLDNDRRRLELLHALLLSLPGSPVLYYGDEIGMGDNIWLADRDAVRTPMQWNPDRNAGFSDADPGRLYLPVVLDPVYGFRGLNVEAQIKSPGSMLHWLRSIIRVRRDHPAFGRGDFTELAHGNDRVLAFTRRLEGDLVLCVSNLSPHPQPVELTLPCPPGTVPVELTGGVAFPAAGREPYRLTLPGHGFYWFALNQTAAEAPPSTVSEAPLT